MFQMLVTFANNRVASGQEPTAQSETCFLVTVANLSAQTAPTEACLQLGQPTSLSIPGIGNLVVSILMPSQDQQCPFGTKQVLSQNAGNTVDSLYIDMIDTNFLSAFTE